MGLNFIFLGFSSFFYRWHCAWPCNLLGCRLFLLSLIIFLIALPFLQCEPHHSLHSEHRSYLYIAQHMDCLFICDFESISFVFRLTINSFFLVDNDKRLSAYINHVTRNDSLVLLVFLFQSFRTCLWCVFFSGCCYEIYVKAVMREEARKETKAAGGSA